jgi:hypothetical protein
VNFGIARGLDVRGTSRVVPLELDEDEEEEGGGGAAFFFGFFFSPSSTICGYSSQM